MGSRGTRSMWTEGGKGWEEAALPCLHWLASIAAAAGLYRGVEGRKVRVGSLR
jgi:hypothetical protein